MSLEQNDKLTPEQTFFSGQENKFSPEEQTYIKQTLSRIFIAAQDSRQMDWAGMFKSTDGEKMGIYFGFKEGRRDHDHTKYALYVFGQCSADLRLMYYQKTRKWLEIEPIDFWNCPTPDERLQKCKERLAGYKEDEIENIQLTTEIEIPEPTYESRSNPFSQEYIY